MIIKKIGKKFGITESEGTSAVTKSEQSNFLTSDCIGSKF